MRKRFVTTLILCLIFALCAFGFTACGNGEESEAPINVAGKTFVFVSIHGEYPENTSAEAKAEWEASFAETITIYKDTLKWIFAEDGTWKQTFPEADDEEMPHGKYVQNGEIIEIEEYNADINSKDTMTVSGNNIIYKNEFKNDDGSVMLTQVQTFKLFE